MTLSDWQIAARAVSGAERTGLAQCPECCIPLNYHRSNLPNSAVSIADGVVTCSRCADLAEVALCSYSSVNFTGSAG